MGNFQVEMIERMRAPHIDAAHTLMYGIAYDIAHEFHTVTWRDYGNWDNTGAAGYAFDIDGERVAEIVWIDYDASVYDAGDMGECVAVSEVSEGAEYDLATATVMAGEGGAPVVTDGSADVLRDALRMAVRCALG